MYTMEDRGFAHILNRLPVPLYAWSRAALSNLVLTPRGTELGPVGPGTSSGTAQGGPGNCARVL